LAAYSGEKTWLATHSGEKNIIGSIFWEKKHDWQHILVNNMIGSTFWKKYIIGSKFCGKT
jgi:outer membrane biogenesis lipoprotein LolB